MGLSDIFKKHKKTASRSSQASDSSSPVSPTSHEAPRSPVASSSPARQAPTAAPRTPVSPTTATTTSPSESTMPRVSAVAPRVSLSALRDEDDEAVERGGHFMTGMDTHSPVASLAQAGTGRSAAAMSEEPPHHDLNRRTVTGGDEPTTGVVAAVKEFEPPQRSPPALPSTSSYNTAHGSPTSNPARQARSGLASAAPVLPEPTFTPLAISDPSATAPPPTDDLSSRFAATSISPQQSSLNNKSTARVEDYPTESLPPPRSVSPPPTSSIPAGSHLSSKSGGATAPANAAYVSTTEAALSGTAYSPQAHLAAHATHASALPLSFPRASSKLEPSSTPLEAQRLALVESIEGAYHPLGGKPPLSKAEQEVFARAGMPIVDPEGKGTFASWDETWAAPVVQEHVIPVETRLYETVVERERHVYHVYPKILPIVNKASPAPEDELHYFRDDLGQWREVRGRAQAAAVVAACERASGGVKDETFVGMDDRMVKAELAELEGMMGDYHAAGGDLSEEREEVTGAIGPGQTREVKLNGRAGKKLVQGERGSAPVGVAI